MFIIRKVGVLNLRRLSVISSYCIVFLTFMLGTLLTLFFSKLNNENLLIYSMMACVMITLSTILVIGVNKRNVNCLLPWIILYGMFLFVCTISLIYGMIRRSPKYGLLLICIGVLWCLYFIIILYYRQIRIILRLMLLKIVAPSGSAEGNASIPEIQRVNLSFGERFVDEELKQNRDILVLDNDTIDIPDIGYSENTQENEDEN